MRARRLAPSIFRRKTGLGRRQVRWVAQPHSAFYPGKNLGACGEAGAITTNDEAMAKKMGMIRDHGQAKKYYP